MTIAIRGPRGGRTPNAARNPGRVGLVVVAATAGLLLAGCGSGPSQAGSAAIVGNTAITLDSVQQELNQALSSQADVKQAQSQGELDSVSREILTEQVMHQVTAVAATRYGINVSDSDVNSYVSKAGGLAKVTPQELSPADQAATARDQVIEARYAAGYLSSLSVTFDYFEAQSQADALTEAKQVAAHPDQFASMVNSVTGEGGDAQNSLSIKLSQYVANPGSSDLAPLFATAPGTVLVFSPNLGQTSSQAVWYVMRIDSRSGATRGAAAAITDNTTEQVLAAVGASLLRPVADGLNVRISPRYGVWDSASMQVVPSASQAAVVDFPSGKAAGSAP